MSILLQNTHFLWSCWSFFQSCCFFRCCFFYVGSLPCHTLKSKLPLQNHSFLYLLASAITIICWTVNVRHLHRDTIVHVGMFGEVSQSKATLTPINTIYHPISTNTISSVSAPQICTCKRLHGLYKSKEWDRAWWEQKGSWWWWRQWLWYAKQAHQKKKKEEQHVLQVYDHVVANNRAIDLIFFTWIAMITDFNAKDINDKAFRMGHHFLCSGVNIWLLGICYT